jgi:hypothetical protein
MSIRKTTEEFILRSESIYGILYDYSKSSYIDKKTKVEIICKKHGSFFVTPHHHYIGHGCTLCYQERDGIKRIRIQGIKGKGYCVSLETRQERFIKKASLFHNNLYDYSLVDFKHCNLPVKIICPTHGIFEIKARYHTKGQGCPLCVSSSKRVYPKRPKGNHSYVSCGFSLIKWLNFASNRTCILYLVLIFNDEEHFIKVGITSQGSVAVRIRQCTKYYNFNIIEEMVGDAKYVYLNEKEIHKTFNKYKYLPKNKIGGYTECLRLDSLPMVMDYFSGLKIRAGFPAQLNLDL